MSMTFEKLERSNSFITCEICARIDFPNSPNFGYDCFTKKLKCSSCVISVIQSGQHNHDIGSLCQKYRQMRIRFREKLKTLFLSAEDHSDGFRNILDAIEKVMWMDAISIESYEDPETIVGRIRTITQTMGVDQCTYQIDDSFISSDFHCPWGGNQSNSLDKRQVF